MAVTQKPRLCSEASLVVTKWTESPWPQGKQKQEKGRKGRRKRIAKAPSQLGQPFLFTCQKLPMNL